MHVFCDFDGTITCEDATDFVLSRLADAQWESIEQEWKSGKIGSAECMRQQIALIRGSRAVLDATLDGIAIDSHFADFVAFCEAHHIGVSIVSDGVDYFIRHILARLGLQHLPVYANRLHIGDAGYTLTSPLARSDCRSASGVCKCRIVQEGQEPRVYVGDGRSDFCVSDKPEIVFAKGTLATFCEQQNIAYTRYQQFSDVTAALETMLPAMPHRERARSTIISA